MNDSTPPFAADPDTEFAARLELALLDRLMARSVESAPRSGEATGPVGSVVGRRRGESVISDGLARASERSSTRRRGPFTAVAAAAVAAAAVVAVAFAGVTLLDSGGEDVGTVTAGRGAGAPGTVLPLGGPIQESGLGARPSRGADASIGAVAVGGPGLVAVGSNGGDAAVWTSADGQTWSRVPDDEAVFGGPGIQGMSDVVVGGPGFVAVGRDSSIVGPDTLRRCRGLDLTRRDQLVPCGPRRCRVRTCDWRTQRHLQDDRGDNRGSRSRCNRRRSRRTRRGIGPRGAIRRRWIADRARGRGVDVDRRDRLVTRSARPCRLRPLAQDLGSERRAGRLGALGVDAGHHARRTRAGGGG